LGAAWRRIDILFAHWHLRVQQVRHELHKALLQRVLSLLASLLAKKRHSDLLEGERKQRCSLGIRKQLMAAIRVG
jgi:Zn-dependent M16 (insulinase) family peptidase